MGLELTDSGLHSSVLSEFRTRLVQGSLDQILLDKLLACCQHRGRIRARGRPRTDSPQVLGASKVLNQLELGGETLRHALTVLATVVPDWLKHQAKAAWHERSGERLEDDRLPQDKTERERRSRGDW